MSENKLIFLQVLTTLEEHHLRNTHHETPKHTKAYYTKHFDFAHFSVRLWHRGTLEIHVLCISETCTCITNKMILHGLNIVH
jgi:hypothetical protein